MIVLPGAWMERFQGTDAFERIFSLKGTVYREQAGRKTLRFSLDGRHYFAKINRGVGWKEIIKNLLGLRLPVLSTETERRAIGRLEQLGVPTMRLVGYGRRGRNPARIESFVITEELSPTISLENFCRDWNRSPPPHAVKSRLIVQVARLARTLHEHGICHRDLYLCHFLLDTSKGQKGLNPPNLRLYVIDLHRVKSQKRISRRARVKDLAALWFSSMDVGLTLRDRLRFIREYRSQGLRETLTRDRRLWHQVRARAFRVYRRVHNTHGT